MNINKTRWSDCTTEDIAAHTDGLKSSPQPDGPLVSPRSGRPLLRLDGRPDGRVTNGRKLGQRWKNKYHNEVLTFGGERFDSKRELNQWLQLKEHERTGQITQLARQVSIPLHGVSGEVVCHYIADFEFVDRAGIRRTWDAKGYRTEAYKIKKKFFEDEYRRVLEEV